MTGNLNLTPLGAILAQNIFQNLPTLHVSCQNKHEPIINQRCFFTKLTFLFIKILTFLLDSSYQLNNNFQQKVWFDRFEKVPILPNFKGIFFYVVDKIYG